MSEHVLTLRQLNRALLARQMLLERVTLSTSEAVERLVGLQSQLSDPPYIGLWTRLNDFHHSKLTRLIEDRRVVRATMMRSTLHLVTANDYLFMRPVLQPALTRALRAFFGEPAKGLNVEPFVAAAQAYIQEQPRTFAQIRARLVELFPDTDPALMAYVVRTHLPLVQLPPGGTWGFTGNPAHIEAETWLGRSLIDSPDGLRTLIFRYLAAFGPATVKDIQTWSGLSNLRESVKVLKPELRIFHDEQGNELYDVPEGPLPSVDNPAPVHFLPEYDNLILSHGNRRRIVADQHRPFIFLSAGRVRATFLVDGFVRGTWKIERNRDTAKLIIEPFELLSDTVRDELVEEGECLVRFVEEDAGAFEVQFSQQ